MEPKLSFTEQINQTPLPVLKKIAPVFKFLISDETWKKCVLIALSSFPGMLTGALTSTLFTWNIRVCVAAGALISSVALITLHLKRKPLYQIKLELLMGIIKQKECEQQLELNRKELDNLKKKLDTLDKEHKHALDTLNKEHEHAKEAIIQDLILEAKQGNFEAQLRLGFMYRWRIYGVEQDLEAAINYFTAAINNPTATDSNKGEAHYGIAACYYDESRIEHLIKALSYGYKEAKEDLEDEYREGSSVENLSLKVQFLKIVLAENHYKTQHALGVFYATGSEPNYPLALQHMTTAANQGYDEAQLFLGSVYENGLLNEQQDLAVAKEWYRKAANLGKGQHRSLFEMARFLVAYYPAEYKRALQRYLQAIERGSIPALVGVGEMYEKGLGVTEDKKKALEYYRQAMKKDDENGKAAYERLSSVTLSLN